MTDKCTTCDGTGIIYGGERGETMEPCPICLPNAAAVAESHSRAAIIDSRAVTMLDRMCDAYWESVRPIGDHAPRHMDLHDFVRGTMRESMRFVLRVMREPTKAMLVAADVKGMSLKSPTANELCGALWRAMIDEILKDG